MTPQPVLSDKIRTLYPFRSKFLELEGVRYHYLDEGEGEVLLMLHGNPTWSFHFRNLVRDLRSRYRVVVPDHIGCGLSDKPQAYEYTLRRHIANLEVFIEKLRLENITLVVHDWGGAIGMGYAVHHVQNIKRFVILNTAAFWMPQFNLGVRLLRIPLVGSFLVRNLNIFPWAGVLLACRTKRLTKDERSGYLAPYDSYAHRVAIWSFIRDIPLNSRHPSYSLLRLVEDGLRLLKNHPMIIFWGGKDPVFTKTFFGEWKIRFPDAFVKMIDTAGHYVLEDGYEEILPFMKEFLENNSIQRVSDTNRDR